MGEVLGGRWRYRRTADLLVNHGREEGDHEIHGRHEKEKGKEEMSIIYKDESYRIIGACFEVYKEKGCGFLEPVYQECLAIEFQLQTIPFEGQAKLRLSYKGRPLEKSYTPDFVCFDKIIVELKAASQLIDAHRAQVHNYLKASGLKLGLLVNFGHYPGLEHERIVR